MTGTGPIDSDNLKRIVPLPSTGVLEMTVTADVVISPDWELYCRMNASPWTAACVVRSPTRPPSQASTRQSDTVRACPPTGVRNTNRGKRRRSDIVPFCEQRRCRIAISLGCDCDWRLVACAIRRRAQLAHMMWGGRLAGSRRISGGKRSSRGEDRSNRHAVSSDQLTPPERAGRQLDRGKCSQRQRDPPRAETFHRLQHAAVAPHEQEIDREAHEARVNGTARGEQKRVTLGQPVASQQPAASRLRVDRGLNNRGDNGPVAIIHQRARRSAWSEQEPKEPTHAERAPDSPGLLMRGSAAFAMGILKTGSIGRSPVARPDRNSRKSTVQPCVESRFRNRL